MYIGEFTFTGVDDVWAKGGYFRVKLYKGGEDNTLVPVIDPDAPTQQRQVWVLNIIGTFGYKDDATRYCMVVEMNDTFWLVSAEC